MTPAPIEKAVFCPYCLSPIAGGEPLFQCPECLTAHHQECWEELGGCATYGCPRMVEVRKPGGEDLSFWGQTEKKCPMCAETISLAALDCPFCHTKFDDIKPMDREDLLAHSAPVDTRMRHQAMLLLIFSALGLPSPITLFIGLIWYARKKRELLEVDASVRAFVLISILISALYIVLVLGGWAIFAWKGPVGDQTP